MIANPFAAASSDNPLPRDIQQAVRNCRAATQAALGQRLSRMEIEFPPATPFGVEKTKKSSVVTPEEMDRSNRELARLFVDMFQPVGGSNIACVFNDVRTADLARKNWDATAQCKILSVNNNPPKKSKKAKGFASKLATELEDGGPLQLPSTTEVALFVAPTQAELPTIERICNDVGMGTLVVLLNARLWSVGQYKTVAQQQTFAEFESVFCLTTAPTPNCLLYRAYPQHWTLARKPPVGRPKPILSQATRPTGAECQAAYDALQLSDVEQGVETVLGNVANWLR